MRRISVGPLIIGQLVEVSEENSLVNSQQIVNIDSLCLLFNPHYLFLKLSLENSLCLDLGSETT